MSYLAKDDPRVLLAQHKNREDSCPDVMSDFMAFVDNTDGVFEKLFKSREDEDKFYVILNKLVEKFLMIDPETKVKLERTEQQMLKDWTKSVRGE